MDLIFSYGHIYSIWHYLFTLAILEVRAVGTVVLLKACNKTSVQYQFQYNYKFNKNKNVIILINNLNE